MNYKPDEATLVSFLYGELEGEELKKVEEYFSTHPEEKKKIEEWSFARTAMTYLREKEVIAPPIIMDGGNQRSFWRETYVRMSLGIAASFLFILVAARLLGLSATASDGEFTIGFGKTKEVQSVPALTEAQVGDMIHASLKENNAALKDSWKADRESLEASIQKDLNSSSTKIDKLMQAASTTNEEQVRRFMGQLQVENLKLMKDYMQLSSTGQKEYISSLLVDFSKYLQEQRKQDLEFFQTRMNSLEYTNDQFKQETEQILTSLITNGSTPDLKKN